MIKAIETSYKGYRFRSRLEARWAVFFDALRIKWLYEPEGFEFEDGTKYLPDFYLPQYGSYVEIKPEITPAAKQNCYMLTKATRKFVMLVCGYPEYEYDGGHYFPEYKVSLFKWAYTVKCPFSENYGMHEEWMEAIHDFLTFRYGEGYISSPPPELKQTEETALEMIRLDTEYWNSRYEHFLPEHHIRPDKKGFHPFWEYGSVEKDRCFYYNYNQRELLLRFCGENMGDAIYALDEAKSARFEHGESG